MKKIAKKTLKTLPIKEFGSSEAVSAERVEGASLPAKLRSIRKAFNGSAVATCERTLVDW